MELLARAAIHRFPIHPVEPKWLLHVDRVVVLVLAAALKSLLLADQVVAQLQAVAQAAVLKSLRAVRLQAAELKHRAAVLAAQFFRLSSRSCAD